MTISYPQGLPLPLQNGYTEKYSPSVLRTSFVDGSARQRVNVFNAKDRELSCTLQLNHTQLATFENFYKNNLKYGCEWFEMPLPNGHTNTAATVRIKNGEYTKTLLFRNEIQTVWQIKLSLDVRQA